MPASWTIEYSDGSANVYRFEADGDGARFAYDPMTPERSSTGMYSGGEPRAGRLPATGVESLWQLVRSLEVTGPRVDRVKGSGLFRVTDTAGERTFVVARGPDLDRFEAFVASLK